MKYSNFNPQDLPPDMLQQVASRLLDASDDVGQIDLPVADGGDRCLGFVRAPHLGHGYWIAFEGVVLSPDQILGWRAAEPPAEAAAEEAPSGA